MGRTITKADFNREMRLTERRFGPQPKTNWTNWNLVAIAINYCALLVLALFAVGAAWMHSAIVIGFYLLLIGWVIGILCAGRYTAEEKLGAKRCRSR